ncbi:hypothetical protein ABT354_20200 [Streptomyces sp. NPDC000594]|uniref:hypothetical protein n=1 Tax=Streptomyces sp. NPDC000594 TaxID=3154261 RepID=UPI00332E65E0
MDPGAGDITVTLYGGPYDGLEVKVERDDPEPWIAIITDGAPAGRAVYAPDDDGGDGVWHYRGQVPWEWL